MNDFPMRQGKHTELHEKNKKVILGPCSCAQGGSENTDIFVEKDYGKYNGNGSYENTLY